MGMVLLGCLFRLLLSVGLPVPRYWASGRGAMRPASSVGTAACTPAALDGAVFAAQEELTLYGGVTRL